MLSRKQATGPDLPMGGSQSVEFNNEGNRWQRYKIYETIIELCKCKDGQKTTTQKHVSTLEANLSREEAISLQ